MCCVEGTVGFFCPSRQLTPRANAPLAQLRGEFHTNLKWYQLLLEKTNMSPSISQGMQVFMLRCACKRCYKNKDDLIWAVTGMSDRPLSCLEKIVQLCQTNPFINAAMAVEQKKQFLLFRSPKALSFFLTLYQQLWGEVSWSLVKKVLLFSVYRVCIPAAVCLARGDGKEMGVKKTSHGSPVELINGR